MSKATRRDVLKGRGRSRFGGHGGLHPAKAAAGKIVDLRPAALLFFGARLKIAVVVKRRRRFLRNGSNLNYSSSIRFMRVSLVAIHHPSLPGHRSPGFVGRGSLDLHGRDWKPKLLPGVWPRCSRPELNR